MKTGAQMYTLRAYTQNEQDLAETLTRVANIGYQTVQLSAIGPIGHEKIKELCDARGLKIVLTHTPADRIVNDTAAVIAEHKYMGCRYIGIGGMPERYRSDAWLDRFALDFLPAARQLKEAGMLLMYHNHNFEWEKVGGKRMIETLMEAFAPDEMGFTLDTYWVQAAGCDVIQWIEKLSGRIPCVHLKDMDMRGGHVPVMAPVGEGNMNFPGILKAVEKAGTEHILVEQDTCLESPFRCMEKSRQYLTTLGY